MLNFCDFIQVYVFTTNHHLNNRVFSLENLFKNQNRSQLSCSQVQLYSLWAGSALLFKSKPFGEYIYLQENQSVQTVLEQLSCLDTHSWFSAVYKVDQLSWLHGCIPWGWISSNRVWTQKGNSLLLLEQLISLKSLLFKEISCSNRSSLFPFWVQPLLRKEAKNENGRVIIY